MLTAKVLDVPGTLATFHGVLDTKTLGGAGFASQRTVGDNRVWNLSDYNGLQISILVPPPTSQAVETVENHAPVETEEKDKRIFTIVLRDCVVRGQPDAGKEINWEWNFQPNTLSKPSFNMKRDETLMETKMRAAGYTVQTFVAKWDDFKAFFRGRPVDGGHPLDKASIKRFNIMMRRYLLTIQAFGRISLT